MNILALGVLASGKMGIWLGVSALLMAFFILLSHSQSREELSGHSCPFHTSLRHPGQGHRSHGLIPGCHPDHLCALGQVPESSSTPPHHPMFNRAHFLALQDLSSPATAVDSSVRLHPPYLHACN